MDVRACIHASVCVGKCVEKGRDVNVCVYIDGCSMSVNIFRR